MKKNVDVREKAKQAGIYLWEIGGRMGLSDANFSRLLRKELGQEEKELIYAIIEQLQETN
ncbi:MAG: hypothetical protein A4E53_02064 [Pelotomaculum sp. PtaB.Bin104]|nr:MAG: hypothetical protein A4E53_02064 [Pelotomaculum sp. PtaB.Bin104]